MGGRTNAPHDRRREEGYHDEPICDRDHCHADHFDPDQPDPDETAQVVPEETTLTALEERQNLLAHHVGLVARRLVNWALCFWRRRSGQKSDGARTLADEGFSPVLINRHITPLALYTTFYHNRQGRVVFFDDVDSIFGSMSHLGLLRSALGAIPGSSPMGRSQLDDLPARSSSRADLIFCGNVIPRRNDAFKAVLSRCDIFELTPARKRSLIS